MREAVQRLQDLGVDPEDWWALGEELSYNVDISWSDSDSEESIAAPYLHLNPSS